VAALYSTTAAKPPAAELAVWGLSPDDFPELDVEFDVWPDNLIALNVFIAMQTQWRVGYTGATGLDYTALPAVLSLVGVPADEQPDTFECLRAMEAEALAQMEKKRG
jgi:hypothetical protein